MKQIRLEENGINFIAEITKDNDISLLHFSAIELNETLINKELISNYRMMELQVTGEDRGEHYGLRHSSTFPGLRMKYVTHNDYRNEKGRKLEIVLEDKPTGLLVTYHLQFFDGISVVRCFTEVKNVGTQDVGLEYISSFCLHGISKEGLKPTEEKICIYIPHNCWQGEFQWKKYKLPDLGFRHVSSDGFSSKRIDITNTGSWSSAEYLPMAYLENIETGNNLFWQIEHNGSWHWEISDNLHELSLLISGPTETDNHWWKKLKPNETFVTVPVAVGSTINGFDGAISELTKYRRAIRRKNEDNEKLPVIFNDYMNCLFGDPTTERLIPLIDCAAKIGCEYFCIDCGWYADGYWWDEVGEWIPSKKRFPNGLEEVTNYIRSKGMIPGLWLEIEVIGINSPKLKQVNNNWFFRRHGELVKDRSRYQLDFTNPEVIEFANEIIDRLVLKYGVGYIKMDYNINAGIGNEINSDSYGDGLLRHNRAYLSWLDQVFEKYPDLVIENCSSGGMRIDYALLSRCSVQSTSDQTNYKKYAVIAANAATGVTPEQAGIWSYPMEHDNEEAVIFNMINALLYRIHQSGHIDIITDKNRDLVAEAILYYKSIRRDIKEGLPFWPLGIAQLEDEWISVGLRCRKKIYLAVWRLNSTKDTCELPIPYLTDKNVIVSCKYPRYDAKIQYQWNKSKNSLSVRYPHNYMARLFELKYR